MNYAKIMDDVSADTVRVLRANTLNALQSVNFLYYKEDADRLKTDDIWVKRFYLHEKKDLDNAQKMILECLKWRKESGVGEITEKSLPTKFFEKGVVYAHGTDKKGHRILWVNLKLYRKDEKLADIKKFFLYWMEQFDKDKRFGKLCLLFDMTDTGLSNVDMDSTNYLINLFKYYYPYFLAYIVIFEMPWILNAAWKIVKVILGDKQNMIKFCDRKTIDEYFDRATLPPHMGGTSDFKYVHTPRPDDKGDSLYSSDLKKKAM